MSFLLALVSYQPSAKELTPFELAIQPCKDCHAPYGEVILCQREPALELYKYTKECLKKDSQLSCIEKTTETLQEMDDRKICILDKQAGVN